MAAQAAQQATSRRLPAEYSATIEAGRSEQPLSPIGQK
jgi:hypothetical protein